MNIYSIFIEIGMVFLYLFICILTTGILGCFLYKVLFLKNMSLKGQLFQKDSLAVWLEFIGGFLAPVLYLILIVISPNGKFVYQGNVRDLVVAIIYISIYIVTFCIFRYIAEAVIKLTTKIKFKEPYILSKEIFIENNTAASFISISSSIIAVGMLIQENVMFENIFSNIIRIIIVLLLNIGLASLYTSFVFPKNKSLLKDIFIEHNISTGILLLANIITINIIIASSINFTKQLGWTILNISGIIDLILFVFFIYLFMMVFVTITKKVLHLLLKVDIEDEIFNQKNIGYVLFESSFYILISFITINVLMIY